MIKDNMIEDLHNPKHRILFNESNMLHINTGIVNKALCVKSTSDVILLQKPDVCSIDRCSFAVWLKHHCDINVDQVVLITPWLTISCNGTPSFEHKISLTIYYKDCSYILSTKSGLWYHLSFVMIGSEIDIYFDGEKVSYSKQCSHASNDNGEDIIVGSSRHFICLDELQIYSSQKMEYNIKEIYNTTVFGMFLFFYSFFL